MMICGEPVGGGSPQGLAPRMVGGYCEVPGGYCEADIGADICEGVKKCKKSVFFYNNICIYQIFFVSLQRIWR